MKKLLTLLSLSAVAAAVAFGVASNRLAKETSATDDNYLPFSIKAVDGDVIDAGGNFTITTKSNPDSRTIKDVNWVAEQNSTYWNGGASFNALDDFYRGEVYEHWTGKITSVEWTQTTRYVLFMLGGRSEITINFYQGSSTTPLGSVTNTISNGNPLMVNYWEVPDSITDNVLSAGVTMHLEIVDDYSGDYGFANFGYLHYNSSKKDISDALWDQMNALKFNRLDQDANENRFRSRWTINHYLQNSKFDGIRELSSKAKTNVDEDFEDNATFLANWYLDEPYNDGDLNNMHEDTVIADFTHRIGDSNLPINKTGNGFFKGFYEDGVGGTVSPAGFVPTDGARYRWVSRPFKLSGTGFISVKMAGRSASLHVVRGTGADADEEHEIAYDLLWANVKSYKDASDDNIATSKQNSVTLVRHIINLSAFKGEVIQIAIADTDTGGGWGAVNFDELKTYYPNYPTFKVESADQKNTYHPYYLDKYISGDSSNAQDGLDYREAAKESTIDNSPVKEAYTFLSDYYSLIRSETDDREKLDVVLTHCGKDLDVSSLVTKYNALSPDAKAIVNASEDFDYGANASSLNWFLSRPTVWSMSESLAFLGFAVPGTATAPRISEGVSINNNSAVVVPVAIGSGALVISALVFFLFRRKRD